MNSAKPESARQEQLYAEAVAACGGMLGRLAAGYEADPDRRRDLAQEIHLQLRRSVAVFDGRCSLKTWTLRVAHNTAASYVIREMGVAWRNQACEAGPLDMDQLDLRSRKLFSATRWEVAGSASAALLFAALMALRFGAERHGLVVAGCGAVVLWAAMLFHFRQLVLRGTRSPDGLARTGVEQARRKERIT